MAAIGSSSSPDAAISSLGSLAASPASSPIEFPTTSTTTAPTGSHSSSMMVRAMTTPYVKPSACASRFITTSFMHTLSEGNNAWASTQVTLYLSDSSGICQGDGEVYSPAVCPSGWTAWWLGPRIAISSSAPGNSFGGFCCAGGFAPDYTHSYHTDDSVFNAFACASGGQGTARVTATRPEANETTLATYTFTGFDQVYIHQAWDIRWQESDISMLTPPPPPLGLCTTTALRSWAPGLPTDAALAAMGICEQPTDSWGGGSAGVSSFLYFVIIFPICMFLLVAGCCTWGLFRYSRRKRARAEARIMAEQNVSLPHDAQQHNDTMELMQKSSKQ
ncbi:uncharacterized protein B0I36DRAFT_335079 [Microdochium trichocladiopsis]|uniref:Uncharacterized protein n=1 Tax=Microdochium trichocladiopsis TaxID=1682393 RepID=A0A9P8XTQ9_9PEZI|nr:uncharacterized protein B0I36DRAFT_335079 [Microdochium trichocladiopsis]KAH7017947.1 hypothetical protein B0I36DRAFT_335079 [Microdochium trichocladiopsis]